MKILVTGGRGYIGSRIAKALEDAGHDVSVFDLKDGNDVRTPDLDYCFPQDAVIHCAGLKSVAESVEKPLAYLDMNVSGTISVAQSMRRNGCKRVVFSSSATAIAPTNPYGHSKAMAEQVLWLAGQQHGWDVTLLRYFNPIGGNDTSPDNLMPRIIHAAKTQEPMKVFCGMGTPDGTGIRDYVHLDDLVEAHLIALQLRWGLSIASVSSRRGYSVLEVIAAFERATGLKVPYVKALKRPGDVAVLTNGGAWLPGWAPTKDLEQMCRDALRASEG